MPQLEELHDQVLETLLTWQRQRTVDVYSGNTATAHSGTVADTYSLFYLRQTQDTQFKRGYWFPGNDQYMLLSFWSGSDNKNRTPNAYLRLHERQGCHAYFTARESQEKQEFFKELQSSVLQAYQPQKTAGMWRTGKLGNIGDWASVLKHYLQHDKEKFDTAIARSPDPVGAEFETKFGFLDQDVFNRSLSRVQTRQAEILRAERIRKLDLLTADTKTTSNQSATQSVPPPNGINLSSFNITAFQGIKNTKIEDLDLATQWIFLTGENGFGKTSILQALAHALGGPREDVATANYERRVGSGKIISGDVYIPALLSIEYCINGELVTVNKTVGVNEGKVDGYLGPLLVAYGPIRLEPMQADIQNTDQKQDNAANLFSLAGTPLFSADYELNQASLTGNTTRFTTLETLIRKVTNGRIDDVQVDKRTGEVNYTEKTPEGKIVAPRTPYGQLATGYKALINLVIDIYLRLSAAQPTVVRTEDLIGMVLIDELENHLHPRLQKQLPISLAELFPRVQFIVSTHSPIPLLGAPANAAFLRVDRDKQAGITVDQVMMDMDVSTLLPTAILSSPLFGFENFLSENLDSMHDLNTADTYNEAELLADLKAKYQQHQQQASR